MISNASSGYPVPQPGASLLLSFRAVEKRIVIYGSAALAASRAFAALEAGANVTIVTRGGIDSTCDELQWRCREGQLEILDEESVEQRQIITGPIPASLVCVTDTLLLSSPRRENADVEAIVKLCREERIPLNVADRPDLSDVSFLTTHRFGTSPLQVGVTTNGRGCRLASRIKRDLVAKLDKASGEAVSRVGEMRDMAKQEIPNAPLEDDEEESTPNRPVPVRVLAEAEESPAERTRRRMKWVAQVSEYWPIDRLARLNRDEMASVLNGKHVTTSSAPSSSALVPTTATTSITPPSQHSLDIPPIPGTIYLVGSGPGHPALLTRAAYTLLTERAQLVLSDKLVPASVLALIPPHVPITIARKFPGNADNAQTEMMDAAIEAARKGLCVVRLKQGDPTIYGRAGEEILYFRAAGLRTVLVPGVSAALAGPALATIAVTQRGAAESLHIATGVARGGRAGSIPVYIRSQTLVLLMGIARLGEVVKTLTGAGYPRYTPVALIERASLTDQRVLETTLESCEAAVEALGAQRPPGMLVFGWTVLALSGAGDMMVLDEGEDSEEKDLARIERWLGGGVRWRILEGIDDEWEGL